MKKLLKWFVRAIGLCAIFAISFIAHEGYRLWDSERAVERAESVVVKFNAQSSAFLEEYPPREHDGQICYENIDGMEQKLDELLDLNIEAARWYYEALWREKLRFLSAEDRIQYFTGMTYRLDDVGISIATIYDALLILGPERMLCVDDEVPFEPV